MLQYLFDTEHLTLFQHQHPLVLQRLGAAPPDSVAISAVTVEEVFRGRLAGISRARDGPMRVLQYRHLLESLDLVNTFPRLDFDQASETEYQQIRALRLHVGSRDLKIAAVALANDLTVLSRNRRDFCQIPRLKLDDWSM
jgi:tRNA(fMet)-specific endonuclease VapC